MKLWRASFGVAMAAVLSGGSLFTTVSRAAAAATPAVQISPSVRARLASYAGPVDTAECEQQFGIACYQPSQIQRAYNEAPLFNDGLNGAGQTIAVIDAFGSPTIARDLATFDQSFGLADPPSLRIVQPAGKVPAFNPRNAEMIGWASETTLDVEWAHVMAPGASILLVETPVGETQGPTGFKQIAKAEDYVVNKGLAGVISQSFSATEDTFRNLGQFESLRHGIVDAYHKGVTVLAASGDEGATEPANSTGSVLFTRPVTTWPPSDPLVTGVGGTQLHLDTAGNRASPDTVWNDGNNPTIDHLFFGNAGPDALASGGGRSAVFTRPPYQRAAASVGSARGVPDVSMSASCDGAVNVYESFPGIGPGWYLSCGTSESTPLFAGIVALADQLAGHPLGLINPALYAMEAAYSPGVVDVTAGSNTVSFHQGGALVTVPGASAGPGYDLATGIGTVDAASFVPSLVDAAAGRPVKGHGREPGDEGAAAPRVFLRHPTDTSRAAEATATKAGPQPPQARQSRPVPRPTSRATRPTTGQAATTHAQAASGQGPVTAGRPSATQGPRSRVTAPQNLVSAPPAVLSQWIKDDELERDSD